MARLYSAGGFRRAAFIGFTPRRVARLQGRGSALILMVAVLALLAVMGTVYILSSRAELASSSAMSSAVNLNLARDAVMNEVRTLLFSATVDAHGDVGGLAATPAGTTPIRKSSRFYDYPEIGQRFGQTDANADDADEPWLARGIYPVSPEDVSILSARGFDPRTGVMDIAPMRWDGMTVVGDPAHTAADCNVYLLGFSSGAGEHYRFGVRIVDLCGMANLNTGAPYPPGDIHLQDSFGQYLSAYALGSTAAIQRSREGDDATPFSLDQWQAQILSFERPPSAGLTLFDLSDELELRSYGSHGASYVCRPASAWSQLQARSIARNEYTTFSFTRDIRLRPNPTLPPPSPDAPPTTAPATQPSPPPPPPSPPYTLTPSDANVYPADCSEYIWPMGLVKVWINPVLDLSDRSHTLDSLYFHARAATNIATAMELAGYSPDESRAFAANYLSYRWNGLVKDSAIAEAPPEGAYCYPAGPSFVDHLGLCVRVADAAGNVTTRDFGSGSDLCSVLPRGTLQPDIGDADNKMYLGFLPQPFINKVAAQMEVDPLTGSTVIRDVAVELYNPYPVALSLRGFKLRSASQSVALDTLFVPARGYLVIVQQPDGALSKRGAPGAELSVQPQLALDVTGGSIVLTRPYIPRGETSATAAADAEIDEYSYDTLVRGAVAGAEKIYFLRRANELPQPARAEWQAAIHGPEASQLVIDSDATSLALGTPNPPDPDEKSPPTLILRDRFMPALAANSQESTIQQGQAFLNFVDFNRIMRICNQCVDPTVVLPGPAEAGSLPSFRDNPLSFQLAAIVSPTHPARPDTDPTDFPADAELHFDFKAAPWFFSNPAIAPSASTLKPGDSRAVRLFDYLTLLDRVYDTRILINQATVDVDKLRIAGRINLNTASQQVLLGLPNMTPSFASRIIAYRDRTAGYAAYPGHGLRTLAELMIPADDAAPSGAPAKNLAERDALWASVLTLCSVRSDAFVVYGYLEVLRANRAVVHNNASDWYLTDPGSTSDDPHSTSAKNIRIARRRWIAILDRSWCNYPRGSPQFVLPAVVAIKDLAH